MHSMGTIDETQPKTKVFISYSRKDMAFATRLVAALEARGIEAKIDRRDLPLLEEWQRELLGFIQQADAVVLIVSPNAIGSKWIEWETQRILELNKRLAPVVLEPVPNDQIPDVVRRINFVSFDPPNDFEERANALVAALNTDIVWIKEHTRIGELARRWAERGRSAADVLRGKQVEEAERWIALSPANAPRPTGLHTEFIQASRRAETRRWRVTAGTLSLALAVTAALGVTAFLLKLRADRERDTALTAQSRFLADQARQSLAPKDYASAVSLALEGLPTNPEMSDRPLVPEALTVLQRAAYNMLETSVVSVAAVQPRYGTYWVDPDSISSTLEDEKRGGEPPGLGMAEIVWKLSTGPRWPWALMTAARRERGADPGGAAVAATDGRVVQARGNRVQILDIATRAILADLPGHEGKAYGAALSSDGNRLVTLGQGRVRAKLWDTGKSRLVADLEGFNGGVRMAAFSENGTRIITADGQGKTARIFDGNAGHLLMTIGPGDEAVTIAALSGDGAMAVTGSADGAVRLWHLDQTMGPRLLTKGVSAASGCMFSPDGSVVVTYFQDGTVLGCATREQQAPIAMRHGAQVNDAAFSRDGAKLVTAYDDHTAIVWDARRGEVLAVLAGHTEPVERACFAPDDATVITLGANTAREWHLVSPLAPVLRGETPRINTATFSPNGGRLFTGSEEGEVLAWDTKTGKQNAALAGHSWGVDTIVFSDDGTRVLTGGRDGKAQLWLSDGRLIHEFKEDVGASFKAVGLSGDGKRVAATSARSNVITIWNADTFDELRRIPDPEGIATKSLAFSKDAHRLLAGYVTGRLKQWDVSTGKLVPEIDDIPETFALEGISGHGGRIVRIDPSNNSRAEMRSPPSVVTTLLEDDSSLSSVRVSPDGTRVAIADISGAVHIVPLGGGARRLTYRGERKLSPAGAAIVRFSADGRMIAVGSDSGDTQLLDAATGAPIAVLPGEKKVAQLEFSRAGDRLVTVSVDGLARLWHVSLTPRALIEEARRLIPRCLGPEAREKVFLERTPPLWCVEMGKWPYQTAEWRQWLKNTRAGKNQPLPADDTSELGIAPKPVELPP